MTCPNCNAPIDAEMKFCIVCGIGVFPSSRKAKMTPLTHFIVNNMLLFGCVVFFWTIGFPAGLSVMLKANMVCVAARGNDICCSIISSNQARKSDRLPPIWPKTFLVTTNHSHDISGKTFKTSTEYFKALYDEEHAGTDAWKPYLKRFDYSKVASKGIPCCPTGEMLTATNNMWLIAANISEDDSDLIPVLITRNVDVRAIERAINYGIKTNDFKTKIPLGKGDYKTPFGNKGFVCVRKGAAHLTINHAMQH
jgi:hypothetical protein